MRSIPCGAWLIGLVVAARAGAPTAAAENVVRMAVRPTPEPRPASRYQLLPDLAEMNPGNPIQGYLKSFMDQGEFYFGKRQEEDRARWMKMPLAELPLERLRGYGGFGLRQADDAARLDTPDWQILLKFKKEGIHLLLPDVQQLRSLANALRVRFRAEVAGRRFDDALVTAKTSLALARHLGEHPTFVGYLVGVAVAQWAGLEPLEEMIQQPGCPNLYWALTDLPRPFLSTRKAVQGERITFAAEFPWLREKRPLSDAELRATLDSLARLVRSGLADENTPKGDLRLWLENRGKDADRLRDARRRLVAAGIDEHQVRQMPVLQVVLLDAKHEFEVQCDDETKLMALPYWQAAPRFLALAAQGGRQESLFGWMAAGHKRIMDAQVQLDQRIAMLRCIEALRMFAADNGGKLPGNLGDATVPVPVPDDPVTGRPFFYRLEGGTATLRGTPPRGLEKLAAWNVRYELTVKP